jgi:hypothetical protein
MACTTHKGPPQAFQEPLLSPGNGIEHAVIGDHVHLYQEEPFCAQLWYQQHLHAPVYAGRTSSTPLTETTCKVVRGPDRTFPALGPDGMFRTPSAAVAFGDVALLWYMRQGDHPLVSSRGHVVDHLALSVADLDAWVAKLRSEGVRLLEAPYELGDTRAVMIEGPSCGAGAGRGQGARLASQSSLVLEPCSTASFVSADFGNRPGPSPVGDGSKRADNCHERQLDVRAPKSSKNPPKILQKSLQPPQAISCRTQYLFSCNLQTAIRGVACRCRSSHGPLSTISHKDLTS